MDLGLLQNQNLKNVVIWELSQLGETLDNGSIENLSKFMAQTSECMLVPFTEIGELERETYLRSF